MFIFINHCTTIFSKTILISEVSYFTESENIISDARLSNIFVVVNGDDDNWSNSKALTFYIGGHDKFNQIVRLLINYR